jgi:hypothetical protein
MDYQKLERVLLALARQHAPNLIPTYDVRQEETRRVQNLARALADYDVLVMMGDFPQSLVLLTVDATTLVQRWLGSYIQFYSLLATQLFASHMPLVAQYGDDRWPVVIYMQGPITPVIQKMAGYVTPYVVQRQMDVRVSEAELLGLMDVMLDELEATNMPRAKFKKLREEGMVILRAMLESPIRQLPVTDFDRPIFSDSQRIVLTPLSPEPPSLPEEDSQITYVDIPSLSTDKKVSTGETRSTENVPPSQPPAKKTPSTSEVPIFFKTQRRDNSR